MSAKNFLTPEQQEQVIAAVKEAETGTSGEIRIHVENKCSVDPLERAEQLFGELGMHKTELRNGVLIYLACQSKVFAIVGDKGINELVPDGFWEDVRDMMTAAFSQGKFTEGLSAAAIAVGEKLQAYFPYQEDDVNELPDDISFSE